MSRLLSMHDTSTTKCLRGFSSACMRGKKVRVNINICSQILIITNTQRALFKTCLIHTETSIFLHGTFTSNGCTRTSVMRYLQNVYFLLHVYTELVAWNSLRLYVLYERSWDISRECPIRFLLPILSDGISLTPCFMYSTC